MMTVSALVKLIPNPPARVDNKKMKMSVSFVYSLIKSCLNVQVRVLQLLYLKEKMQFYLELTGVLPSSRKYR